MGGKVRVLIVEPHPVTRIGLQTVLQRDPSIELLGTSATASEALEQCARLRPSITIMDVALPDGNGIEVCRTIKRTSPHISVLILSAVDDNATVFGAISAGASGYVLKDILPENLLRAIHALRNGQTMLHPGIARRMLDHFSQLANANDSGQLPHSWLTRRETEILIEVAKGATNKEIGHRLYVSESTVKSRLRVIFGRIGAHDRTQATAYAIREGYMR